MRNVASFLAARPGAAAAAFSAAMLAGALAFEHLGGMKPCELCMAQRWCHMTALGLGLASLNARGRTAMPLALASGIALVAGAAVAGYHVGVEEGLWAASCSTASTLGRTLEELLASLSALPAPRCDEVAWRAIGLSMAAWNGLASLVIGIPVVVVALRRLR